MFAYLSPSLVSTRKVIEMQVTSINPADGTQIAEFEAAGPAETKRAMEQARRAQPAWASMLPSARAKQLGLLGDVIRAHTDEILDLIQTETGRMKPDAEAEVFDVLDAIPYYIEQLSRIPIAQALEIDPNGFPDTEVELGYAPHGVIALIMPWNFPFYLPMMTMISGLITGNAIIIKPSEYSTLVGIKIAELVGMAGFPNHLVHVVPGADDTGRALIDAGPDKIFFVGSAAAGEEIIARAGVIPVQVELGGNSAALVLQDADLDLAANGVAWAGTYHAGQDCAGIKRVFVHRAVADEFIAKTKQILESLRPGIDYGPYITTEARDNVKHRIDAAVAAGANLITGGLVDKQSSGNWMTPSIVTVADQSLDLVSKETFGNVVPVQLVDTWQDAVVAANATTFGLSSAVFTRDIDLGRRIAAELASGMVFINDPFINLPGGDHWTGWRRSGFGTMESKLEQCLRRKVVGVNLAGAKRSFWYPY
jgi:acyl-CoA reductase-like NAD-dependent aldehyde dehydrogenase